jgi:nucleoside-diphosphate-sugar epimerase
VPNLDAACKGVEVIIHLAARVHIMQDSVDGLSKFQRVNVKGSEALASCAARQGVRRLIFVSTAKVHGESTCGQALTEDTPSNPQDPYSVSKWEAEESLRSIARATGLEVVIIRPPLIYGSGVRANFLRLIKLVDLGMPLPFPDTKNQRSLLGVENLADFLVRCVSHRQASNQTFLVSDGEDPSTRDLIVRLARALGRSPRFLPLPTSIIHLIGKITRQEASVNRLLGSLVISSQKAQRTLEWKPPFSLNAGLEATARWYLETIKR